MIQPTSYVTLDTIIGSLWVAGDEQGVTNVVHDLKEFHKRFPNIKRTRGGVLAEAARSVQAYLKGKSDEYSVPLHLDGTEFQQSVWEELLAIPYGETASYSEIAQRIGKPKAYRAVANACGQNPLPLIIPCHRVLQKDNSLGGFAWGVGIKKTLLCIERDVASRAPAA